MRDGSRVVSELSETPLSLNTILTVGILDTVKLIAWLNSEDGAKGTNRPKSVLDSLFPKEEEKKDKIMSFDSGEAFEAARRRILEGKEKDG